MSRDFGNFTHQIKSPAQCERGITVLSGQSVTWRTARRDRVLARRWRRRIIPPVASVEDKGSVIALWANDEHNGEDWNSFYWVWKDEVWPTEFSITSCDDFLNRYLGSGNTVEFIG